MDFHDSNLSLSIKSEEEEDTRFTDNDSACMFLESSTKDEDEEKKTHELFELLKNWKQLELFEHFTNEKIDLEVLAAIKPHHFERLLEPFNLRTHIMFEHNLQQWRASIGIPLPKYPSQTSSNFGPDRFRRNSLLRSFQHENNPSPSHSPNQSSSSVQQIPQPTTTTTTTTTTNNTVNFTPTEITGTRANLETILSTSIKGKMLIDIYNQNKKFEEAQRTLLIHLIAEYFTDKGFHLELSTTHKLEKEIIEKFPTEQLEYYRTSKRGRIYNKFCNYKYSLIKVARSSTSKDVPSTSTAPDEAAPKTNLVPEEDAAQYILLLNMENLSEEKIDKYWNACTKYRINEIQSMDSLPLIFQKWHQYKLPNGHKYISMDFKYLQPNNWNNLVNNWDFESKKLFKFLCMHQNIKSNEIKVVLSSINDNISKDCRDASLMWCLHGYLKPTFTICGTNRQGKKSLLKISIKDSQNAFVYIAKSLHDIERHREILNERYDKIYPFIAVLGTDIMNFSKIFVCIEDIKYSVDSFVSALDLCHKIISLFKLEYPAACKAIWSFIQNIFFETKPVTIFPRVHVLINDLKYVKINK